MYVCMHTTTLVHPPSRQQLERMKDDMNRRHRDGMQVRRIAAEEGREYVLLREGEGGFVRDGAATALGNGSAAGAAVGSGRHAPPTAETELRLLEEADDDSDLEIQIVLPGAQAPAAAEEEDDGLAWEDVAGGQEGGGTMRCAVLMVAAVHR